MYFITVRNVFAARNVFTRVCHSVHGGVGRQTPPWHVDTPLVGRHTPAVDLPPPGRQPPPPPRTATAASYWNWNTRILLECILVARCERTLINCATFVQLRTTSSEHVSDIETLNFDKYRNSVKIKLCEMKSELQCLC